MQTHELQSYVNQICTALTPSIPTDVAIGAPLIDVAKAILDASEPISDVAKALHRIADVVEKTQIQH